MKPTQPYYFTRPPRAIHKARLDTIALVPASLLLQKGKYQTIVKNLPGRSVLICDSNTGAQLSHTLDAVAAFFRQNGHFVKTLPSSLLV